MIIDVSGSTVKKTIIVAIMLCIVSLFIGWKVGNKLNKHKDITKNNPVLEQKDLPVPMEYSYKFAPDAGKTSHAPESGSTSPHHSSHPHKIHNTSMEIPLSLNSKIGYTSDPLFTYLK